MADIFFKSEAHRARFLTAIKQFGKVYDGKVDPEYGAAFYVLTSDESTWNQAKGYVSSHGINFDNLLQEVDLGGSGYTALIKLAGNLFNDGYTAANPVDLMGLDNQNFEVALNAFRVRRKNWLTSQF